jgi:hypothetical protein
MKRIVLILTVFMAGVSFANGQALPDSITVLRAWGEAEFFQGNIQLTPKEVLYAMRSNEEAHELMRSARATKGVSDVIGFAGGFMVGWTLGDILFGREPNWTIAGVGAGLLVVSIPITSSYSKQAEHAVATYNRGLRTTSFYKVHERNLLLTGNGVGLVLRF